VEHYIKDKVVIVTGGSSGFGLETARILIEMGARVVITGRNRERLDKAASKLAHDNLLAMQADAVKTGDWQRLVEATMQRFGRIDVLVNNAGAGIHIAPVEEQTDEDIAQAIDINLTAAIKGSREVMKVMKPAGRGHIVNIASVCASHAWAGWAVYSAAKAGIVLFTRCLHLEMVKWGGKATTVIPAAAKTGFSPTARLDDSWQVGFPIGPEFARTIVNCIDIPDHVVIEELTIWGTEQTKMLNPY